MDGNCAFLPIFGACFSPWVAVQSSAGTNKRRNNIFGHEGVLILIDEAKTTAGSDLGSKAKYGDDINL